jgi:hypothetical protein
MLARFVIDHPHAASDYDHTRNRSFIHNREVVGVLMPGHTPHPTIALFA